MADQLIQRAALDISSKPRAFHVALDQAAAFQHLADAGAELLDECLQLALTRRGHRAECWPIGTVGMDMRVSTARA